MSCGLADSNWIGDIDVLSRMRTLELRRGVGIQTAACFVAAFTLALTFLVSCSSAKEINGVPGEKSVYIVIFDDMPIVTYNGKITGLRGTAKYFSRRWRRAHKRY